MAAEYAQVPRELLKRLEWAGVAHFQFFQIPRCVICGGLASDVRATPSVMAVSKGHKPGCELKAILDRDADPITGVS